MSASWLKQSTISRLHDKLSDAIKVNNPVAVTAALNAGARLKLGMNDALELASERAGSIIVVEAILTHPRLDREKVLRESFGALTAAIRCRNYVVAERLLAFGMNPTDDQSLDAAIFHGERDLFDKMLPLVGKCLRRDVDYNWQGLSQRPFGRTTSISSSS